MPYRKEIRRRSLVSCTLMRGLHPHSAPPPPPSSSARRKPASRLLPAPLPPTPISALPSHLFTRHSPRPPVQPRRPWLGPNRRSGTNQPQPNHPPSQPLGPNRRSGTRGGGPPPNAPLLIILSTLMHMHSEIGIVAMISRRDSSARRRAQQPGPSGSAEENKQNERKKFGDFLKPPF